MKTITAVLAAMILTMAINAAEIDTIEENWVKSVLPNTKIERVRRSPVAGFYTALLANGQVLYVNPFQRMILIGEIFTSSGENLTAATKSSWQEQTSKQAVDTLDAKKLIDLAFGDASGDKVVVMVTSPHCPYCHRADAFFESEKIPVKRIFLVNTADANSEDYKRIVEVMQAPKANADKLISSWRTNSYYAKETIVKEATIKSLEAMQEFAANNQINGTPHIYFVDRKNNVVDGLIVGFGDNTSASILTWFKGVK
jgi:thiol:disulfide interchange protein DsbC